MSLNPKIEKDSGGNYWLRWTPDPSAEGYAFVTPGGSSRTFDATRKETRLGKGLTEPVQASVAVLDVISRQPEGASYPPVVTPPNPPTGDWECAPPREPITRVINPTGLGLLVNNVVTSWYSDYIIDGGGDSSVLLQGTKTNALLERFHITRTKAKPTVTWAAHAAYVKAAGNVFRDFYADNAGGNGVSGLSVRMRDNLFERTVIRGYGHAATYYEHDGAAGRVVFRDGDWTFTGDTAFWSDDSNEPPTPGTKQEFVFENIDARGGPFFAKFRPGSYKGKGVTIRGCTLNGKPVTAAMVAGVPNVVIA